MTEDDIKQDDIVVIRAFDEYPEHLFRVSEIFEDCVTGYAITGPLNGEYGEPAYDLILKVYTA